MSDSCLGTFNSSMVANCFHIDKETYFWSFCFIVTTELLRTFAAETLILLGQGH